MQKSFLQQFGESMSGFLYGIDIHDLLTRQEVDSEIGLKDENGDEEMKALNNENKRY